MSEHLQRLDRKAQKGSKPRCHWLTHGEPTEVAARLTKLIAPWGAVSPNDRWMPVGFEDTKEAEFHQASNLLSVAHSEALRSWWLAVPSEKSKTPNLDLAFTCSVEGVPGLTIVEAKAHNIELEKEVAAKKVKATVTANSCRNHARIACCIQQANCSLTSETGHKWCLSHESHYQISNRFTWAWKLSALGYPVILVYLGFLKADEMQKGTKQRALVDHEDWASLVTSHTAPLFPDEVWNRAHPVHGQQLIPVIRSMEIPFDRPCDANVEVHR